mgnify:CR=1 FL=1
MKGARVFFLLFFAGIMMLSAGCTSEPEPVEQEFSDEAFSWNGQGVNSYIQGNFTEALGYFDKAIEAEPGFPKAWSNRGLTLIALGRYQEAADAFNRTLEIDPTYPSARENRETALSKL